MTMRFTRWYPLAEAGRHAPAGEGVLQLRLASGLVDYPTGKSAMVYYAAADDVRAAALRFAADYHGAPLWCRHLDPEGHAVDVRAYCARLLDEFSRRFGCAPTLLEPR